MVRGEAHVGFIGFGAVARDAHRLLAAHPPAPRLTVLLRPGSASRALVPPGVTVVESIADLVAARPDLVVEAAGQHVVAALVPQALAAGIPALVVSTGAFAEPGLLADMTAQARAHGTRLLLSAGAVAGLDYVEAAGLCPDARLRYTSRKPPAAWRAELAELGRDASTLASEVVLFEGSPDDAARRYPRNLNVALTIKLRLGTAADGMTVRVVADPDVVTNTHEIEVESRLGTAAMRFANVPSESNPKTSALTGHTLAAEIRKALA
jgi:aspartate dehydrogenase